jgi:hypothetical protein
MVNVDMDLASSRSRACQPIPGRPQFTDNGASLRIEGPNGAHHAQFQRASRHQRKEILMKMSRILMAAAPLVFGASVAAAAPATPATPATPSTGATPATPADPSTGTAAIPATPATAATPATPAEPAAKATSDDPLAPTDATDVKTSKSKKKSKPQ